jgi:hypothetical protein
MNRNLQRPARYVADSNGTLTEGQVRWWIHNADQNGLAAAGAIIRVGRCIFLDVDAMDRWFAAQTQKMAA